MAIGIKDKTQLTNMGLSRGRLPSKRSINLALSAEKKKIDLRAAIPAILLVVAAAFLFSKFAVVDRLMEMSNEQAKAAELQRQVDRGYEKIESYGDLVEQYAHYTYSGMTKEELTRADRVKVLELIERLLIPNATVDSWQLNGNVLSVTLTGSTLQEINLLAQTLGDEPMVQFCKVTTARTNEVSAIDDRDEYQVVKAKLIVYLNQEVTEE